MTYSKNITQIFTSNRTLSLISQAGWLSIFILFAGISIYSYFFIGYTLQKHFAFQTTGYDLANYAQAFWNTLEGKPLAITTVPSITSRWQAHFEPTLLLFTPVYALYPEAATLLVIQVVFVALGAIPIFFIAKQMLESSFAGLIFAVVYLLFPALQGALVFDFHSVAIAVTFFSFSLWFLINQKYGWLIVAVLLAMGCKEDMPLVVFMMGGYILFIQRSWRWAVIVMGMAAIWFVVVNFVIIPEISPSGDNIQLGRYQQWGHSLDQIIINLVTQPHQLLAFIFTGDRLLYWVRVTMPVAFTALLAPFIAAMALPVMIINTLSANPPNYQLDRYHYSIVLVPFIVVASIIGIHRLVNFAAPKFQHVSRAFLQNVLLAMVLFASLAYQTQFGHTPMGRYFEWPTVTERHQQMKTTLTSISPLASVAAQNNLIPHLSERAYIFTLPAYAQNDVQAQYIAFDIQSPATFYNSIDHYCEQMNGFLNNPNYGLIVADNGLYLFKINTPNQVIIDSFVFCP